MRRNLVVKVVMSVNTSFQATFAGSPDFKAATSQPTSVQALAITTGRLSGYYGTANGSNHLFYLYHYSTKCQNAPHTGCPTFTVTVVPNHAGKTVHFTLQVFSGHWATVLSFNDTLASNSKKTEVFI